MLVSEIIDLISQFAFPTTPTLKQRKEYLRCLNLANRDLYQIALDSNYFFRKIDVFVNQNGEGILPNNMFYLKRVYAGITLLMPFDLKSEQLIIKDNEYFVIENIIEIGAKNLPRKTDVSDGQQKPYITLLIVDGIKNLVETVNDHEIETDIPVFPEPHHHALVQGALYYVFIAGKGFIEKSTLQLRAYEESKKNLARYYGLK